MKGNSSLGVGGLASLELLFFFCFEPGFLQIIMYSETIEQMLKKISNIFKSPLGFPVRVSYVPRWW